jgi:hypothetical protein
VVLWALPEALVELHQWPEVSVHFSLLQVVWAEVVVKVILILVVQVVQAVVALQPAELQDLMVQPPIQAVDYQLVVLVLVPL